MLSQGVGVWIRSWVQALGSGLGLRSRVWGCGLDHGVRVWSSRLDHGGRV